MENVYIVVKIQIISNYSEKIPIKFNILTNVRHILYLYYKALYLGVSNSINRPDLLELLGTGPPTK